MSYSPERLATIDQRIAALHANRIPGHCYTQNEIAEYVGCSRQAISLIEIQALAKVRAALAPHIPAASTVALSDGQ